jgi:DNA-binding transcriptional LysR family regulator
LVDYRREAPRVDLNLVTGPTRELIDMVRRRRLDCALVAGPVDDPFLRSEKVIGEELVVVMAERWASMEDYYRSVGNPTVLVFREGCSYRERFLSVLARRGWSSFTRMEFGTLDGIMGCVESDIGITMVPLAVAEMAVERHGVRIHHLSQVESVIDTMLIWRADAFETRAFGIFRGALTGIFPRPS